MIGQFIIYVAILSLTAGLDLEIDPFSDEFIDWINSQQSSWKAGRNFAADTPIEYIKRLCGVPLKLDSTFSNISKQIEWDDKLELPKQFDAREKWPQCNSIKEIRDQGSCGSCWAFSSVSVMSDRHCIHKGQSVHFSAQQLVSCCKTCAENGCNGSWPYDAFEYYKNVGIVSGGNYNSKEGCYPYEISPCEHYIEGPRPNCKDMHIVTPQCKTECQSNYNVTYDNDKHYGGEVSGFNKIDENMMRQEIFLNGPISACFFVFADFIVYKSGVYKHMTGPQLGVHAVRIIGWGEENGDKYWLIANSWNNDWGDKGFFKIARGNNECGIEQMITFSLPK